MGARKVEQVPQAPTIADMTVTASEPALAPLPVIDPSSLSPGFVRDADVFAKACRVGGPEAVHAAWLQARALAEKQRRDGLPLAANGLTPAQIRGLTLSVYDSPKYVFEVGGEYAELIWANIPVVALSTFVFLLGEYGSGALFATGTPFGETAALAIQAAMGGATGYALTSVNDVTKRFSAEWVLLATAATSPLERAEASKAFVRTVGSILMELSSLRGGIRIGGNVWGIAKPALHPTGMPPLALAGVGPVGSLGDATTALAGRINSTYSNPTPMWLAMQHQETSEGAAPKHAPTAAHFSDAELAAHTETMLGLVGKRSKLPQPDFLAEVGKAIAALAKLPEGLVKVRPGTSGRIDRKTLEVEVDPGHLDGSDLSYMRTLAVHTAQIATEIQQMSLAARWLASQGKSVAEIIEQLGIHKRIAVAAKAHEGPLSGAERTQAARFLDEVKLREDFARAEQAWHTARDEMQRARVSGDNAQLEAVLAAPKTRELAQKYSETKAAHDALSGQKEIEAVANQVESRFISASKQRPQPNLGDSLNGTPKYLFDEHSMTAVAHTIRTFLYKPQQSASERTKILGDRVRKEFEKLNLPAPTVRESDNIPQGVYMCFARQEWMFLVNSKVISGPLTREAAGSLIQTVAQSVRAVEQFFGALSHQVHHLRLPDSQLQSLRYRPDVLAAAKEVDRHRPTQTEPLYRALSPNGDRSAEGMDLDRALAQATLAAHRARTGLERELRSAAGSVPTEGRPSRAPASLGTFQQAVQQIDKLLDQRKLTPLQIERQEAGAMAERIFQSLLGQH